MELRLYDTMTRDKRVFTPIDAGNVRMYVCGPTVYDFAHIGNARPVIVFDVLFRLLRHIYGEQHVTYVRNITDVDDKINDRALRDYPGLPLNEAIRKVTEKTADQFQADVKALGCLPPTVQPRATDFVLPRPDGKTDMRSLIQDLLDQENAYLAIGSEGKEILFDVSSMPDYGALSNRRLEEQMPGARIAVDGHKRNAEDFVLWKESGAKQPGWKGQFVPNPRSGFDAEYTISAENASELQLNSRLVAIHGRPGWHIECSAMSAAYLGNTFDIHGGGLDLIFPHHENEIAQSRCAHRTDTMANYWMHNGFLQVEGAKMSKSLGNFLTISQLLDDWPGEVLRLNMLKTHYRSPIDWTVKGLEESSRVLEGWYRDIGDTEPADKIDPEFLQALLDDLNTHSAISRLHQISPAFMLDSSRMDDWGGDTARRYKKSAAMLLGLLPDTASDRANRAKATVDAVKVDALLAERTAARARKDFKESDRIRDELAAMGVVIKDSKDGTTWEIAR
jgi:cysteinyl-tRNA synthetase